MQQTTTLLDLSQKVYGTFQAANGNPNAFKRQLPVVLHNTSLQMKDGALNDLISDLVTLQDCKRNVSIQLLEVSKHFTYTS